MRADVIVNVIGEHVHALDYVCEVETDTYYTGPSGWRVPLYNAGDYICVPKTVDAESYPVVGVAA